jgi:hypothetical protein
VSESDFLEDTNRIAALKYLDLVDTSTVINWANEQVARSHGEPQIIRIAIESASTDAHLIAVELDDLLVELGGSPMSGERAGWQVARLLAEQIIGGSIEPEVGASQLWWDVAQKVPVLQGRLRVFNGLSSLWEDDARHRSEYETDIVQAAEELLGEVAP